MQHSWAGRRVLSVPIGRRSNPVIDIGTTTLTPQGWKIPMPTSFNRLVCFLSVYPPISYVFFVLLATGNVPHLGNLRRGRSLLGREQDVHESGLALFRRGTALRRKRQPSTEAGKQLQRRRGCLGNIPGPHNGWVTYCYLLTLCMPPFLLRSCGERVGWVS
jgi:hypothetical protein